MQYNTAKHKTNGSLPTFHQKKTSGFIGLVLHSGLNPGELFEGIRSEYSGSAASVISDISDTVKK